MSGEPHLAGKAAVVTGAGKGIDKSIALAFAKAGADLAICARSESDLAAIQTEIEAHGQRCFAKPADLGDATQAEAFCDDTRAAFGHVDIIVNNAGAYLERGAFEASDPDLWWRTMEVNLRGPYLVIRHLLAGMRNGGKIINLNSGKGYSAGANSSAYHSSKAALRMMTEGLANELWPRDIDVNTLIPGPNATETFDNPAPGAERMPEEILALGKEALPKGLPPWERVKHPDEVAALALQMATQPVGGPTGQVFSLARRPL
ncbi:Short-chain dehydrogenase/reductase SDR [Candidatus Rhodobacter oscarellae]|uniref:Short-chain dehydrogenase/reductase SDR n=1 Tax=Candidatus Rhodobacter oscarellae TaxID=1675527 RepID=A0A0J9EBS0_9RHOB|nr:SDR family oxidoreductase [Candidatus Rhodobacter lobularis]KMW59119.1 Short-chain dehydrogenase/reductase SDR [Candidatus Rhodobacter lobularis]